MREDDINVQIEDCFRNKEFYQAIQAQLAQPEHVINHIADVLYRNITNSYGLELDTLDYEHVFTTEIIAQIKFIRDLMRDILYVMYDFLFRYNLLERTKDPKAYAECLANQVIFRRKTSNAAFFATLEAIRDRIFYSRRMYYQRALAKSPDQVPSPSMKGSFRGFLSEETQSKVNELIKLRFEGVKKEWDPWVKFFTLRGTYAQVGGKIAELTGQQYAEPEQIELSLMNVIHSTPAAEIMFDLEWIDNLLHADISNHAMNLRFHQIRLYFDRIYRHSVEATQLTSSKSVQLTK
jgi:hypothetical protein